MGDPNGFSLGETVEAFRDKTGGCLLALFISKIRDLLSLI